MSTSRADIGSMATSLTLGKLAVDKGFTFVSSKMHMKRGLVLVFALSLLSIFSDAPADAYPPGQNITINASDEQVQKGTYITLSVNHAKPGSVTVKFGAAVKRTVAANDYQTPDLRFAASAAGIYVATATDSTKQSATTKVFVPSATIPSSARVSASVNAVIRYAKPGSVVVLTTTGATYTGIVAAGKNTLTLPFSLRSGKGVVNDVNISVGGVALPTLKITGK